MCSLHVYVFQNSHNDYGTLSALKILHNSTLESKPASPSVKQSEGSFFS